MEAILIMKTEKIKDNYTEAEGFEWKAKCSRFKREFGYILNRNMEKLTLTKFDMPARFYLFPCEPVYIPYSEDTLDELEGKAMRMTVIHRKAKNRYTITSMLFDSFRIHDTSYTYKEALESFSWSDGSIFGTEVK